MTEASPRLPRLRPAGPVVSADEQAIWAEASTGLAATRRHAVEMQAWARDAAEADRARARAEGFAAGAEEAARLVAETAARARAHLNALERDLPDLVYGIVTDILGAFEPGDLVARSVRRALATTRSDVEVVLRVSPGDLPALRTALAGTEAVRIEADPSLGAGECVLRSAVGTVALGVEAQLRALRAGLDAVAAAPAQGA